MLNREKLPLIISLVILTFGIYSAALSQSHQVGKLKYISPVPGSKYVMPGNNIALRHGEKFDPASLRTGLITVEDEKGCSISGELTLSDDGKTLIFLPDEPFSLGALIKVTLLAGLKTISNIEIKPEKFDFEVTGKLIDPTSLNSHKLPDLPFGAIQQEPPLAKSSVKINDNNYPDGYAFSEVLINNNPPEGLYFYAPFNGWNWFPDTEPFINIVDQHGIPLYYRKFQSEAYDLKLLNNGLLSCYSYHPYWGHIVMDSSYRFLDIYKMGNGYTYTDFHEFLMLDNGHTFVMTFDPQLIDMSLIVPGGNEQAIVTGFVFQELDTTKNVIFQWRSWDHFEITDTGPEVDLTAEEIDYVHGNAIEIESDSTLLISSRNLHEITKINRNTGEIIWRLGGSQNQFDFGEDTLRFSRQHDSRLTNDGHITAFDNGTYHPDPKFSSAVEYEIDTVNMTATLINRYRHDPDYFGGAMGNGFWTNDETVVIGWGTQTPAITEVDHEGNPLWEVLFQGFSYRAYRFPWKSNYFTTSSDSLVFDSVYYLDTIPGEITIYNNQPHEIAITSDFSMTAYFDVLAEYPVYIAANDSVILDMIFTPDSVGVFNDILTLNSDINTDTLVQRVAQQVHLLGYAKQEQGILNHLQMVLSCYPNPVKDIFNIRFTENLLNATVEVQDLSGRVVMQLKLDDAGDCQIDFSQIETGLYLLKIIDQKLNSMATLKVLKQ
ncbi:MAG TPA: arylsulfotransferase family protein [Bacteroidales bacterium]|nr:arylsulfotransferase family protein [Bacteroidales bacterium]HRX98399.1 arylsulfotransferase family protein [Bacteroidales bacterium]